MRFSWKLSISMLVIQILVMGLGGYVLLEALFSFSWKRELQTASEENRMLAYSFAAYWNTGIQEWQNFTDEEIQETAEAMTESMTDSALCFGIYDENGESLYIGNQSRAYETEELSRLLEAAAGEKRAGLLFQEKDGETLVFLSPLDLGEKRTIYLESSRDVSVLFAERKAEYRIYRTWMAVILLLELPLCFFLSSWLLRPLRRLSGATRRIADGDLKVRAKVETADEVGELTRDFNQMAEHLEEQFTELRDTARRQEDFIGSFAHELKTPLTSMIGYADMLRSREMTEEERLDAANYIFKEGKRLEALSFKLLDLLVLRQQELKKREVSAAWLADETAGILEPVWKEQGIEFQSDVREERILAEPDLMKTVLINLLDNGRKALLGQETKKRLFLLGRPEKEGYAFYVHDTGKGIPKEELSRITEAFYMVDKSRARSQGGAGLGLSICVEIVQRHGGTLSFQSEKGRGTLVRVWIPREEKGNG